MKSIGKTLILLLFLYLFLSAISLMGDSFKLLGHDIAVRFMNTTSNPFIALFIGLLVTSLVQSSSVTTSMVVGLVSGGALSVANAVPIIMGANMGTTVTNTIVSVGHISRNDEFERAYAGATVHDFFNMLTVAILLPLELFTHWMEGLAGFLSGLFYGIQTVSFHSPVKSAVRPFADFILSIFRDSFGFSPKICGIFGITVAAVVIFLSLAMMVKNMRSLFAARVEHTVNKIFGASGYFTILIGVVITAIIQSSSITTSILIPLLGAGLLTLEHAYPLTIGANIGTTVTAIIAALAGNRAGLTIAFVHLIFNLAGLLLFFPIPFTRKIPIDLARKLAALTVRTKKYALLYVVFVFFVVPLVGILLTKLL